MEPKTKRYPPRDDPERFLNQPGDYPNRSDTVSATETTGLIPAPPQSDAEYESYQTLHGMEIPKRS